MELRVKEITHKSMYTPRFDIHVKFSILKRKNTTLDELQQSVNLGKCTELFKKGKIVTLIQKGLFRVSVLTAGGIHVSQQGLIISNLLYTLFVLTMHHNLFTVAMKCMD